MPRRASGSIIEHVWTDGSTVTFSLRVSAHGRKHRVALGTSAEGWSRQRAQVELDGILDRIARGTWAPVDRTATPMPEASVGDQGFRAFASEWWARREPTISENTRVDYSWRLEHLVAFFADDPIAGIDAARVDAFVARKHAQNRQIEKDRAAAAAAGTPGRRRKPLGAHSINMLLTLLGSILEDAVDHDLLARNPMRGAQGKRRRVKEKQPRRDFLEPDMTRDLLAAAGRLEQAAVPHQKIGRRPMLATLALVGLRRLELCDARIGHLDVAQDRLRVPDSKTEKGRREVELPFALACELREHLAFLRLQGLPTGPTAFLFPTSTGKRRDPDRLNDRIVRRAAAAASETRAIDGLPALPEATTPHTLRRTAITLMLCAGRDPRWVMDQVGHTDPKLTLRVYAQVMRRRQRDDALIWSLMRFADEPEDRGDQRRGPATLTGLSRTPERVRTEDWTNVPQN